MRIVRRYLKPSGQVHCPHPGRSRSNNTSAVCSLTDERLNISPLENLTSGITKQEQRKDGDPLTVGRKEVWMEQFDS
ncbi:MAG: hypothetical protein ACYST6_01720 [Planctomycetota bacterium]